jgi:hypothetical protein
MTIKVTIHYIGADNVGRGYKTVERTARDYKCNGILRTAWVRVDGRTIKAEKYGHTVWTAELHK